MSLPHALSALAALPVPGVAAHFPLGGAPPHLYRAQLPALLIQLDDTPDRRLAAERSSGFHAVAFAAGARTVEYHVVHALLLAPYTGVYAGGGDPNAVQLAALLDGYFAALAADPTLGGALAMPARVIVEPGALHWGDDVFAGCALRHTWTIAYQPGGGG